MKLFASVVIFLLFLHNFLKFKYPNLYLDLTYKCIYLFSKLQIELSKWIKKSKMKQTHKTDELSPSLFKTVYSPEGAVFFTYSNEAEIPTTASFVEYKILLMEVFIEGELPELISFKDFMLCGNILKPNAVKYILNNNYKIDKDLLAKYRIHILDDSASSHEMNETQEIEFTKEKFVIRSSS